MRFSARPAWVSALLCSALGCDELSQPPDPAAPTPIAEEAALVAGSYYLATNNFRGLGSEYLPNAGADIAKVEGKTLLLHVPVGIGGPRVYQMDDLSKTFADATQTLLPTRWGLIAGYSGGTFVDLNNDGFKDILLIRDKGMSQTTAYLYDPVTHVFRLPRFAFDLDLDGDRTNEIKTFFGSTDISYHARRVVAADIDGDGDDDLFIGRRRANYIFENLSAGGDRWDCSSANAPRFAPHLLDAVVPGVEGALENQIQLTQVAVAYAPMPAEGAARHILAADSKCVDPYCADSGVSQDLYVHVYAARAPNECVLGNGICEAGEDAVDRVTRQATNPDCARHAWPCPDTGCVAGNGVCETDERGVAGNADCEGARAPVSCKFKDHLRQITPASATAVAALDRDGNGFMDFLVFGGPESAAVALEVASCFRNPAQASCAAAAYPNLGKYEIRGIGVRRWADAVAAPAPLSNRWAIFADVAVTTSLDADARPEIVTYSPLTKQAIGSASLTAVGMLDVAADGALRSPGCGTMAVGDGDAETGRFIPYDLNGDGRMDFSLQPGMVARTYWGNVNGSAAGRGCVALDLRMPLTNRNISRPTLADLDRDGDLDLIAGAWADTAQDPSDRLFLRNTNGRFSDVTAETIGALPKYFGGATLAFDIDNDDDNDLVLSNYGPLQVFRNDGANGWTDISAAVLPPWYTTGGNIHGADYVSCAPYPVDAGGNYNAPYHRCYPIGMAVADFDGNGGLDIALVSRKGANDILFNNLAGTAVKPIAQCVPGAADSAWCTRIGFLSARSDLHIRTVLPGTSDVGWGNGNRSQVLLAVDLDRPAAAPLPHTDLVVLGSPSGGYDITSGEYDRAFLNGITAPFPHVDVCEANVGCPTVGDVCVAYGGPFPRLSTCWVPANGNTPARERIVHGWLTPRPCAVLPDTARGVSAEGCALPTRDAGNVVDRFGAIACAASGDLNADGRVDFVVATSASEYTFGTDKDSVFEADGSGGAACALNQGHPANQPQVASNLTDCDVVYECKTWKCAGSNPGGDGRWTNPLRETDSRCCQAIPVVKAPAVCGNGLCEKNEVTSGAVDPRVNCAVDCPAVVDANRDGVLDPQAGTEAFGPYTKSVTCAAARGDLETCDIKGYQKIGTYGNGVAVPLTPARSEAAIFVYLGRGDGYFTKYKDPIALAARAGKDSLYMSCNIADFNRDNRQDFLVTGYLMGDMPAAVTAQLPTPAGTGFGIRRYAFTQPTRMWLNPGWDKKGVRTPGNTPAIAGAFPMRSDKVYGSVVGNVDGDADIEVILSGTGVNLFDRK